MKQTSLPYPECTKCKDLGDCPCPDVDEDGLGTPLPPDSCPCPISVIKETLKKRKKLRNEGV
jgi:hypothetical protein